MRSNLYKIAAAVFALAIAFTLVSCGNHTWQDIWACSTADDKDIVDCSMDMFEDILIAPSSSSEKGISSSSEKYNPEPVIPNDTRSSGSQGKAIVEPLLKTQWGNGSPFDPFHTLPDGSKGWVDCVTVSTAQIMKYYDYPLQAIAGAPYQGIIFDWNNMLDTYMNVNPTEPQQKAIAALVHSMYNALQTGAGRSFVNNFGYDKTFETHYRKYYDNATWVATWSEIIKKQLDAKLPVMAHGTNLAGTSNHGFVIDGYDNKGKFHINWGWGGRYDGYYSIDSLNPGRALEEGWHNTNFKIYINIQPDKGGIGTNTMALDNFSVGKTAVDQYELFNIKAQITSFGRFSGQIGTALVGSNGSIAKVIGIRGFTSDYSMDIFVPEDVNPGQYKLQIVTKFDNGDWKLATLSDKTANIPSAINLTVKAAEQGAPGGGYGLALTKFTSEKNSVTAGEVFDVSMELKNMNEGKYPGGQFGVALTDNGGNIVEVIESLSAVELASGYARFLNNLQCKVPSTVPSGKYRLRIVVKQTGSNAWRVATMSVNNTPTAIDFTVK